MLWQHVLIRMSTYTGSRPTRESGDRPLAPAYGPVDAALGFALFYVIFDRVTPTVVTVLTDALPEVSGATVGLGLAMFIWFVFGVTLLDQISRQLAAFGLTRSGTRRSTGGPRTITERLATWYLALGLVGGLLAVWTFERAMDALVSTILIVSDQDVEAFVPEELVVLVVFFLAFAVATHAIDRLVVGGLRTALAESATVE